MSKKQTKAKSKTTTVKFTRALVLFGTDENGTPRAARFVDEKEDLVARAAQAMGLRLGIATKAKHFEVVRELPVGRIHATGKTAVPNISQELYDKLNALVGGEPGRISTSFAKSWEELAPGHLVVAQASLDDGWWSAVSRSATSCACGSSLAFLRRWRIISSRCALTSGPQFQLLG